MVDMNTGKVEPVQKDTKDLSFLLRLIPTLPEYGRVFPMSLSKKPRSFYLSKMRMETI